MNFRNHTTPIRQLIFLALILFLLIGAPAQASAKMLAAILTSDLVRYREAHRAFVKVLASKGYDQSNMEILMQTPNPDPISWANSIRKFKALGANIIVTYGAPVTLAAMREVSDVPILFIDVYGPVETGITRSLSMTGSNLTGISSKVPMTTLIKTIREIKPLKSLGVIYNSREVGSVVQLKELRRLAAQQGFYVIELNASSPTVLDASLATFLEQIDCLYVSEGTIGSKHLEKIIHRANNTKVPVISQIPDSSEKGVLVALEVSPSEQGQMAGEYAVKLLGGRTPSQLPILTPKRIELIVNMKTARLLDLHIPIQVLNGVSRVIK